MAQLLQPSFTAGELSPDLYARVDLARYAIALRQGINYIVRPTGGIMNRPGTRFVYAARYADQEARLVPFVYSVTQTYMLEFGEEYIWVYANGARVTIAPTTVNISSVSFSLVPSTTVRKRNIITSSPHGLTAGDSVTISGVTASGDYQVNGTWTVTEIVSTTQFRIKSIMGSPSGSYTSGGSFSSGGSITTPYAEEDLDQLTFTQSADVLTVCHPDYPPHEFRRLSATTFEFEEVEYEKGPFRDLNTDEDIFVWASAVEGTVQLDATQNIFEGGHIGGLFKLEARSFRDIPPWESDKRIANDADPPLPDNPLGLLRRSDGKVYRCVTDQTVGGGESPIKTGTIRPVHTSGIEADGDGTPLPDDQSIRSGVDWEYLHDGIGIVRITAVADGMNATATVLRRLPESVVGGPVTAAGPWTMTGDGSDVTLTVTGATSNIAADYIVTIDGELQSTSAYSVDATTDVLTFLTAPAVGAAVSATQVSSNNRTNAWAFGAWSDAYGYPREVEYFAGRIVFASTDSQPQSLWMSKVDNFVDFLQSSPVVDDDGISATLNARQINTIRELVPLESLIVLTQGGEWRLATGSDDVVTPSSVGFKLQSSKGVAEDLPALVVDDAALFVQRRTNHPHDVSYQYDAGEKGGFIGDDLAITANHLVDNTASQTKTIVDWAYQAQPFGIVWLVRADGVLLSLTYMRKQQVIGWMRHDVGGYVERVCCIPEGTEDGLYMIVRREIDGSTVRYVERLTSRLYDDIREAVFMDSALSYDGRHTGATTMTLSGSAWTVDDTQTLTASASTFEADDVGDRIVLRYAEEADEDGIGELRLEITAYTSATVVTVRPTRDVPAGMQAVAQSSWGFARDVMSGLDHLEGEEVSILADGNVMEARTVEAGVITLDEPCVLVHAGVYNNADAQTLDVMLVGQNPVRMRNKAITRVGLLVQESRNIKCGTDADHLEEYPSRSVDDDYGLPELTSGLAEIMVTSTWNDTGRFLIRQDQPLPSTILGVIPDISVGG